jgi:hypothetical protein
MRWRTYSGLAPLAEALEHGRVGDEAYFRLIALRISLLDTCLGTHALRLQRLDFLLGQLARRLRALHGGLLLAQLQGVLLSELNAG